MYKEHTTTEERSLNLFHTIDPGLVNRRKIQTLLGQIGMNIIDEAINKIPKENNALDDIRIDHIYTDVILTFCKLNKIKTLSEVLSSECGTLFCSTEEFAPCDNIYKEERTVSKIIPRGNYDYEIEVHFTTKRVTSDTMRYQLNKGDTLSVIAELNKREGNKLIYHPFIIGAPWLHTEDPNWVDKVIWWNRYYYENFIEDFDEFKKVEEIEDPKNFDIMKEISESAFKSCIAEIIGDTTQKDWGGETSDHYSTHIRLNRKRIKASFIFKGPSRFAPMDLNHLGKNNDQIYRLTKEPADVFFVQHCHDINQAVRETLRAFAVQPSNPRRYCLIDGRDSLRLLKAYNLLDKAIELSK
jgi:hypothetical protein